MPRTCVTNSRVNVMFCVAGFRPGRRGPFVPAKGPKTSAAPSGLIGADGRQPEEGGPTRGAWPESCRRAQTRPASG
jgi:hypothetical protein